MLIKKWNKLADCTTVDVSDEGTTGKFKESSSGDYTKNIQR